MPLRGWDAFPILDSGESELLSGNFTSSLRKNLFGLNDDRIGVFTLASLCIMQSPGLNIAAAKSQIRIPLINEDIVRFKAGLLS